jgi:hypothetical protein
MPIMYDETIPLDNKQLRLYDKSGQFTRVSVDEAIARKLNYWKGWACSAGERMLYIDYDGRVWIANCASAEYYKKEWIKFSEKVIGQWPHEAWYDKNTLEGWPLPKDYENCDQHLAFLDQVNKLEKEFFKTKMTGKFEDVDPNEHFGYVGNMYDRLELPEYWADCPFDFCGCGSDVILAKAKDEDAVKHLAVSRKGYDGQHKSRNMFTEEIKEQVAVEMNFPIRYQILWDLGRRCNYSCDYCWNGLHNLVDPHHSYEAIKKTILYIIKNWAKGKEIRWNFGGGEPTMHKKFLDIVKLLKEHDQWILITSNGSRATEYWDELKKYCNTVNFSAHFGSMSKMPGHEERFIENVNTILDWHDEVDDDHWMEIKLMTPPGWLDHAIEFKNKLSIDRLTTPGKNDRMKGCCSFVPIRDDGGIVSYSEEEIKFFETQ